MRCMAASMFWSIRRVIAFVGPTLDFDTADRDRAMAVNLRAPLAVIDTNCSIWQSGLFADLRCSAASAEIEVIGASMTAQTGHSS